MRGVVSLAAAFAVPLAAGTGPFPDRDLILFLTFAVIVATLLLQGLTLPLVGRRLQITGVPDQTSTVQQAAAEHTTARLALVRLDQIVTRGALPADVEQRLRHDLEERARRAHAILGPDADDEHLPELVDGAVVAAASYTEARQELPRLERAETRPHVEPGRNRRPGPRRPATAIRPGGSADHLTGPTPPPHRPSRLRREPPGAEQAGRGQEVGGALDAQRRGRVVAQPPLGGGLDVL